MGEGRTGKGRWEEGKKREKRERRVGIIIAAPSTRTAAVAANAVLGMT